MSCHPLDTYVSTQASIQTYSNFKSPGTTLIFGVRLGRDEPGRRFGASSSALKSLLGLSWTTRVTAGVAQVFTLCD